MLPESQDDIQAVAKEKVTSVTVYSPQEIQLNAPVQRHS